MSIKIQTVHFSGKMPTSYFLINAILRSYRLHPYITAFLVVPKPVVHSSIHTSDKVWVQYEFLNQLNDDPESLTIPCYAFDIKDCRLRTKGEQHVFYY
jgi:hypothetical protein